MPNADPGLDQLAVGTQQIELAVPKGHPGRLAYINEFIEDAKASGLVNRIIETLAMQGVRVAPPEGSSKASR